MRVFISQPMHDKTNAEILKERETAIADIKARYPDKSIEIIDTFFEDAPHLAKPLWYLGKALELLSTADVAYFCDGWGAYRGCKIEHQCAVYYDIDIIYPYGGEVNG